MPLACYSLAAIDQLVAVAMALLQQPQMGVIAAVEPRKDVVSNVVREVETTAACSPLIASNSRPERRPERNNRNDGLPVVTVISRHG